MGGAFKAPYSTANPPVRTPGRAEWSRDTASVVVIDDAW